MATISNAAAPNIGRGCNRQSAKASVNQRKGVPREIDFESIQVSFGVAAGGKLAALLRL
jgi:hypothetical protein